MWPGKTQQMPTVHSEPLARDNCSPPPPFSFPRLVTLHFSVLKTRGTPWRSNHRCSATTRSSHA